MTEAQLKELYRLTANRTSSQSTFVKIGLSLMCASQPSPVNRADGDAVPVAYYRDIQYDGDDYTQREYNGINEFSGGGAGFPLYAAPLASTSADAPTDTCGHLARDNWSDGKVTCHDCGAPIAADAQAPVAWQPMKTAPRDGRNILIRFGQDGASQSMYVPGTPHPWKFIDTNDGMTWLINAARDNEYGPTAWMPMPMPDVAAPIASALPAQLDPNRMTTIARKWMKKDSEASPEFYWGDFYDCVREILAAPALPAAQPGEPK